jgi:hypothetical protein
MAGKEKREMKPDKEPQQEFPKEIAITEVYEYGNALIVKGYPVNNPPNLMAGKEKRE